MSVDIKYLRSIGISRGQYKPLFTAKRKDDKIVALQDLISSRIKDWRTTNLRDWPIYHAIDLAHRAQFNQTTATMVRELMRCNWSKMKPEDVQAKLAAFGISEADLFLRQKVTKGETEVEGLVLNVPVLYNVLVPLVVAYHSMRTAKLFVERDLSPLLAFKPLFETDRNRTVCEIWTAIIDTICTWFGYPAYLKQAIQQTLKYGIMIAFPLEEWHCEKQVMLGADGKPETVVQKEGLRYHMPHPTRMGYDLFHPLSTINSDTGCEWAFNWSVVPFSQINSNRLYWNKETIPYPGDNWMAQPQAVNYFREVYPCTMNWPTNAEPQKLREEKAAYYATNNEDDAIFLANYFGKIIPAQWGLGNYKYPVWHRFTMAGDDTIIWAQPCAYNPLWFMGYDYDALAAMQSSYSLECIPWQDTLGNVFSQSLLTGKQNLNDVVYYDINIIKPEDIEKQKNLGEERYRSRQYIPFDSRKLQLAGLSIKDGLFSPNYQWRDISSIQSLIASTINIMERILGVTAQEVGAAAAHYQSAKEVGLTNSSTSQRLASIGSGIDDGVDAWKRQLREAALAYANDGVIAQISVEIPDYAKHIEALGFKVVEVGSQKVIVKGNKKGLPLESFARSNTGPVTTTDPQMAQTIFQAIGVAFQNPEIVAAIGVPRIIKLMEQGARLAGAPHDFDITTPLGNGANTPPPAAIIQQLKPVLDALQQSILQTVTEKIAAPAAEQDTKQQQQIDALMEQVKAFDKIFAMADANQNKLALESAKTQQKLQLDQASFEAEERRKDQAHQNTLRREAEKLQAVTTLKAAETAAGIHADQAETAASIESDKEKTKADIEGKKKLVGAQVQAAKTVAKASASAAKSKAKATAKTAKKK